jgi:hypothetical protein
MDLPAGCLKVRIADFHRNACTELLLTPKLKGKFFNHRSEYGFHAQHIDAICIEGTFSRYGFALGVRHHRRVVDAVGLVPDDPAFLSEMLLPAFELAFHAASSPR